MPINSEDGSKFWKDDDFVPHPHSPIWDDLVHFIQDREERIPAKLF